MIMVIVCNENYIKKIATHFVPIYHILLFIIIITFFFFFCFFFFLLLFLSTEKMKKIKMWISKKQKQNTPNKTNKQKT